MGLVQAQMAFYHDLVGTKAQNEIFEVKNENLCAELESAGYVKKLEAEQDRRTKNKHNANKNTDEQADRQTRAVSMASP